MDTIETIEYKGFRINISIDDNPVNPRQWDNLGIMTCFHRSYGLGDEHDYSDPEQLLVSLLENCGYDYEKLEGYDMVDLLREVEKDYIILPLFLYDHSGLTMNTAGFACPWDSRQVGFIYVPLTTVREEYGVKRVSKKLREKVKKVLRGEVAIFDDFLRGNVYGYDIEPTARNRGISCNGGCWGYYGEDGLDWIKKDAKAEIDHAIERYKKEVIKQHKERKLTALFLRTCWAD